MVWGQGYQIQGSKMFQGKTEVKDEIIKLLVKISER